MMSTAADEGNLYQAVGFPPTRALVVGTGLTVLDRLCTEGVDRPFEALGGSCGNVLVSLAMLGHCVAPVVALGNDAFGDFLLREFRRAGCQTDLVYRKADLRSPIIIEHVDPVRARHWFSFSCPETSRWRSIDEEQVSSARRRLKAASVFYTDRLSPIIVDAMETAKDAGALVFFEPASRGDEALFARALRTVSILKFSDETAGGKIAAAEITSTEARAVIRTHGTRGLTVSFAGSKRFFPAMVAPRLVDTCGSGDMVTTGLLDHLLRRWSSEWSMEEIFAGIEAGQRLAALNCGFAGARGLFHALGGESLRSGLDEGLSDTFFAHAITSGPYDGH
jgi:fructokinase